MYKRQLKKNPGKYSYASSGTGGIGHLQTELFKSLAGVFMTHIPYRGAGPALNDVVAGQVNMTLDNLPSSLPFIKDGRLKPLAVTSTKRLAALPDTPTLTELGLQDLEIGAWQGIVAPAGTPREVVDKVNSSMMTALKNPEFLSRLQVQQTTPLGSTPEDYGKYILAEIARWDKVVKENGITMN